MVLKKLSVWGNNCWQGVILFPWSQWIFSHLLKGCRTKQVGHESEFGPCADPLVSKTYMMTDGEFLSWRDSAELLFVLSQHPFVSLSLFALSLSSCHSLPVVGVHAFLPRLALTPAYPQVKGCRESTQSSVGWVMHSRQSRLCWQPLQGLLFQLCATASWFSCMSTSSSFSFGTVLSNRAMKVPADGIL